MNRDHKHRKSQADPKDLSEKLFAKAEIPWKKSKDEIWKEMAVRIEEEDPSRAKVIRFLPGKHWLALAASIALLIAVAGFTRFYSVKTVCPAGEHYSLELPDGSSIELNAHTTVSYHPYWWPFSRRVDLVGEAYFDVKEGKQFRIVSSRATTEVLGTSFSIYSRKEQYSVTCHSGKVRVTSHIAEHTITLSPEERADLNETGAFDVSSVSGAQSAPGWMNNLLMFASTPLRLVFDEIERQYAIVIETPEGMHQVYSGNFALSASVDNVLSLICRPFDLMYEQTSGTTYLIYPARMD